jgi:hypothetical protein
LVSDNLNIPVARARAVNSLVPGRDTGVQGRDVGVLGFRTAVRPAQAEKRCYEAEGAYQHGPLRLRAEQIFARDGTLERRGGYALSAWRLSPRWEPLTRADWLTSNIHKANATSIAYLAGLNLFVFGTHVKVGVNTGAQHDQGPKGFSSPFLAQTMLSF